MRERVHRHGARLPTGELMRRATGVELGSDALIAHLERSYTGLSRRPPRPAVQTRSLRDR